MKNSTILSAACAALLLGCATNRGKIVLVRCDPTPADRVNLLVGTDFEPVPPALMLGDGGAQLRIMFFRGPGGERFEVVQDNIGAL